MDKVKNGIELRVFSNYERMSEAAATYVYGKLQQNTNLLLCPAAGNTPTKMYKRLVKFALKDGLDTTGLRIIKLDEWVGVSGENPASCEYQLQKQLIDPLNITHYCSFNAENEDTKSEIEKYDTYLSQNGAIDICVLGLGLNGHLGFNEPSNNFLEPFAHKAELSATSQTHQMISGVDNKPTYGLTLGMRNILSAKSIILLVSGIKKKQAFSQLMKAQIDTKFPASFLWLHPNVICFCDEEVYT